MSKMTINKVFCAVIFIICKGTNGSSLIQNETSMLASSEASATIMISTISSDIQTLSTIGFKASSSSTNSTAEPQTQTASSSAVHAQLTSVPPLQGSLFMSALEDHSESKNTTESPVNRNDSLLTQHVSSTSNELITMTPSLLVQSTTIENESTSSVSPDALSFSTGQTTYSYHLDSTSTPSVQRLSSSLFASQISPSAQYATDEGIGSRIKPTIIQSSVLTSSTSTLYSESQTVLETPNPTGSFSSSTLSINFPSTSMLSTTEDEAIHSDIFTETFKTPTQTFVPFLTASLIDNDTPYTQSVTPETIFLSSTTTRNISSVVNANGPTETSASTATVFLDDTSSQYENNSSFKIIIDASSTTQASVLMSIESSDYPFIETGNQRYSEINLRVSLNGKCALLENYQILYFEFSQKLLDLLHEHLNISASQLEIRGFKCNPMIVNVRCDRLNTSELRPLHTSLQHLTRKTIRIVHEGGDTFFNISRVDLVNDERKLVKDLGYMTRKLGTADYAIISAAIFLFAMLVTMGLIVIFRECYTRSRGKRFTLEDMPHVNIKMADFSLIKIPRPKVNYCDNVRKDVKGRVESLYNEHQPSETVYPYSNNNPVKKRLPPSLDPKDMRVRMSAHEDGIVVGITSYSRPPSPQVEGSIMTSSEKLIRNSVADSIDGITNIGYIDGDKFDEKGEVKSKLELML